MIMPAVGEDERTGAEEEDTREELVVPLLYAIPVDADNGGDAREDVESDIPKAAKLGKY